MTVTENPNPGARWSIGGVFLEALAARDYRLLAATLAPEVRFRAMLPPGPMGWEGSAAVADVFSSWFGSAETFELVDATVGEVGGRLHLSWRLRVRPAPFGIGDGWHVIEQHAYADAADTISSLDLLCSGFRPVPANDQAERQEPAPALVGRPPRRQKVQQRSTATAPATGGSSRPSWPADLHQ